MSVFLLAIFIPNLNLYVKRVIFGNSGKYRTPLTPSSEHLKSVAGFLTQTRIVHSVQDIEESWICTVM